MDVDLWAIWVGATKLGVGLVVFDPTYSNMFEEVQDKNARMKKLLEHYGRIGFRPFQEKIWNGETVTFLVLNVECMGSEEEAGLLENGIVWFPEKKPTADPQHN